MVKKRNDRRAGAGQNGASVAGGDSRPAPVSGGTSSTAGPDGRILPLLLLAETGAVVDVAWMNTKGFNKSREQGVLWAVHDETGRLLPYAGNTPFLRLVSRGRWYQAVVSTEVAVDLANAETDVTEPRAESGAAGKAGSASSAEGAPATRIGSPTDSKGGGATESAGGPAKGAIDALQALRAVIERRKRELPEGSYTTYLFKAGAEKIRKKTGEEAIELLLARERGDIIAESADLIYHLLVLLAEVGEDLDEVVAELDKRSST